MEYSYSNNEKGKKHGEVKLSDGALECTFLHGLRKGESYNGLYLLDPTWFRKTPSMVARLRKDLGRISGNVVYIDLAKRHEITASADVVTIVDKERRKDFNDPNVVSTAYIDRGFAASQMRPKYEKCYVILDKVDKMRNFDPDVLKELLDWNCTVFVAGID